MENFNHSSPGIAQIGYVECENIHPNIVLKHSSGIPVGVFTEITPIRFFGQPSYEAVEEYDNNGHKVLCALKFVSNDNIPLHKHLAFVITDASGTPFIIGSRERPYPVVKSSATSGTTPTRLNYFRHLSLKTKKKIKAIGSEIFSNFTKTNTLVKWIF